MKKTIYMLPAFALMLFAACSSEDAVTTEPQAQQNETPDNAIGFSAYLNRTTTRAGKVGVLDNDALKTSDGGFGVFGYYGNGDLYSENTLPDFMYNQKVTYSGGNWNYAPVKYWPNEFGSKAVSTGVDRVTFFAYAPYVEVTPNTGQPTGGDETTGITSLTRNGKTGDPYVRYVGAFDPDNCVDLCYGVAGENFTSSAGEGDGANEITAGQPYLNVAKPAIDSRINFVFKHALAKLTVKVDADVDIVGHSITDNYASDNMTRVWIRSITFNGIAPKGYLNLHSGYWYDAVDNEKISRASVTVYDGRRDGSEANAGDTYEYPTGLNEDLVQTAAYDATFANVDDIQYNALSLTTPAGVTTTYKNLFKGSGTLLVIPANEQMKVTIVYDVETADATLPTYLSDGKTKGSTVENKITKEITLGGDALKLESGKAYTLNLHLGMTGVKFKASVSNWDDASGDADVDLPHNSYMAVAAVAAANMEANAKTVDVAATDTKFGFTVTGLTANETVTKNNNNPASAVAVEGDKADANGVATVTVTLTPNTTTSKVTTGWASAQGASKGARVNFTQAAHKLEPTASALSIDGTEITISAGTGVTVTDWSTSRVTSITKDGTPLTLSDYTYDPSTHKVTLTTGATAGTYVITIKVDDTEEEEVSVTVS